MDWWYFLSVFPAVLIGRSFCTAVNLIKVAIVPGFHLFPFRTEKLSPTAPMVLRNSGRVGSRRLYRSLPRDERGGDFCMPMHEGTGSAATRCLDRTSATALRRPLVFLHFLLFFPFSSSWSLWTTCRIRMLVYVPVRPSVGPGRT